MNYHKCDQCDFTSKFKSNVNRHEQEMHEESSEESDSDDQTTVASDSDDDDETINTEGDLPLENVWPAMGAQVDEDENILQVFKRNFSYNRSFENDAVVTAVIKTMQRAQKEDDMDLQEALDYAIEKRKYLIIRQVKNDEEEEEGSNSEDAAVKANVNNSTPAFPYSRQ